MHLYAVDTDATELTLPGINIDYNQLLQQRNDALQELHVDRPCYSVIPGRYGIYNRDVVRRVFPPEQDNPDVSCENCCVFIRRAGLGHEHAVCCVYSSIACGLAPFIVAPCLVPFWPWQLNVFTWLTAALEAATWVPVLKCANEKTKEDDERISLRRLQRMYLVPTLELEELHESSAPTYAASSDD